ncbi:uncharacterized protein N7515_008649 [Penicillium bovifimosum]|uniref:Uncharacterized protein n=1 Tax=Penicillium bovifimosum TaxID=126998 RepID=A0A9W9KWK3_9EURO|nr:uncharacterized protein N7515_008649 [Penicillium bovifimosum]KAJ5124824.1 hypothetical protein N7515_008649 [Penicillium bovifimosum]
MAGAELKRIAEGSLKSSEKQGLASSVQHNPETLSDPCFEGIDHVWHPLPVSPGFARRAKAPSTPKGSQASERQGVASSVKHDPETLIDLDVEVTSNIIDLTSPPSSVGRRTMSCDRYLPGQAKPPQEQEIERLEREMEEQQREFQQAQAARREKIQHLQKQHGGK